MSYFDFFCKNSLQNNNNKNDDVITGTCYSMCPQDEVDLRTREKLIHVLEVIGTEKKLVKSFSRSAADSTMALPGLLRPYSVLKETLHYLLFEVLNRPDVPTAVLYDFVEDRLRAIRQDMTIQRLPTNQCACLLEPMIRFYVYFGYRLQELPIKHFDPVLNKKHLLECMKWFLYCCDSMEQKQYDAIADLSVSFLGLNVNEPTYDRALMESLYILCNLTDLHPLLRYLSLSKDLKSNPSLQLAYGIAVGNMKGNFISICRQIDKLCPLTYYAIYLHLPELQKHALQVLSYGYNNKQLTVPGEVLQKWLRFSSKEEALAVCRHYGLECRNGAVRFAKGDYKKDVPAHRLQRSSENKRSLSMKDIFTYKSLTL